MPSRIKPHISFYDKSFLESNTGYYYLSLQLGKRSLSLTVFNPDNKKYVVFDSFAFNDIKLNESITPILDHILNERKWLGKRFQKVFFLIDHQFSTLVPPPLFFEDKADTYIKFNHPVEEEQTTCFNKLNNAHIINVFSISKLINDQLGKLWPNIHLYHCSSAIIESLSINYKNKISANNLFLNVRDEGFDLVYFKNKKLHFYNMFRYHTKEDFIYFVLSAMEELQLNPEEVELVISGNIDKSSILYEMIFRYIRTSRFIERNDSYGYSYLLDGLMGHKYYTLFNAQQCE
ncbi:MAG: hypothetical protein C0591_12105 [Marinilabiliales bacterium]|jgi:hypothetical protein|nr:MAG: hypothetical protein C0591_12105 [Marinilabiliales bacterium]